MLSWKKEDARLKKQAADIPLDNTIIIMAARGKPLIFRWCHFRGQVLELFEDAGVTTIGGVPQCGVERDWRLPVLLFWSQPSPIC